MRTTLGDAEVRALTDLGASHRTGQAAAAPTDTVARALQNQRLATPDEFGGLEITERGQQHLAALSRRWSGARAGRASSPGRLRRGR